MARKLINRNLSSMIPNDMRERRILGHDSAFTTCPPPVSPRLERTANLSVGIQEWIRPDGHIVGTRQAIASPRRVFRIEPQPGKPRIR